MRVSLFKLVEEAGKDHRTCLQGLLIVQGGSLGVVDLRHKLVVGLVRLDPGGLRIEPVVVIPALLDYLVDRFLLGYFNFALSRCLRRQRLAENNHQVGYEVKRNCCHQIPIHEGYSDYHRILRISNDGNR